MTAAACATAPALPGEWWRHNTPFLHLRARNVFDPETYARLVRAFADTAAEGRAAEGALQTRKNPGYDADITGLDHTVAASFRPLLSRDWIDGVYRSLGLPNRGRVDAALHSSPAGSRTGWIHTDLCSAWFDESRPDDGPGSGADWIFPDRTACEYFSGKVLRQDARPREYARAGALIYYLANDGWTPGDGGETAFYSARTEGPHAMADLVAPVSNSLILFPCTPHSYHRFIGNPGRTRNSIILWVHTTIEDAIDRWGRGHPAQGAAMRPVCLVTGASGRLGEALCADLAGDHEVVAIYRSRPPRLASQLMRPLSAPEGSEVYAVQADLTRREDIRRVVEVALARHGRIDAVVNCAADVAFHGRLCELWDAGDEAEGQLRINAIAPLRLVSAVHQGAWKDDPDGNADWNRCVVNVSSWSGVCVGRDRGQGVYAASKAALNILTLHLASELAPYSVRVNALCPDPFDDARTAAAAARDVRTLLEGEMTGEVATAQDLEDFRQR